MLRLSSLIVLLVAYGCGSEPGSQLVGAAGGAAPELPAGGSFGQGGAATSGNAGVVATGAVGGSAAGGATPTAGSGGITSVGGSGGGAGASEAGTSNAGTAGQAGAAGSGGSGEEMDQAPWRPLAVTAPPDDYSLVFKPSDADPEANQQNGNQIGRLDTRVPSLGKLVVDMGSSGGANLGWFPARGFHFLAVDFMGVNEVPDVVGRSPEFYGDVRLESLTGEDRVPDIDINFHDSFEGHVSYGLAYLHTYLPDQDWGYYLNQDGSVRWSDVIVTGRSHGASSTPRFAKIRRLWRAVSRSGPRDNTCGTDPNCELGIVATWFSEESKTPLERYFSLVGSQDPQFPEIQYATETLGYLGEPVNVDEVAPPYDDSHRLVTNAGHAGFCDEGAQWDAACNYLFGVPPENQ